MDHTPGKLIAAMGLPGCGKSSVFRELRRLRGWTVFNEPEEDSWPEAVHNRSVSGWFTAITWFRAIRVPQLFQAHVLRQSGDTVLVDSYFDKLLGYYLNVKGMEWLIPPDDPYFQLTAEMARLDRQYLPDADVVVAFEVDEEVWRFLLRQRNRKLDEEEAFLKSFSTQQGMIHGTETYCRESGARLLRFKQTISSPPEAASALAILLKDIGIV